MMTLPFGASEDVALWRVQGTVIKDELLELGDDLAILIGMSIVGGVQVDRFPTAEGKGGAGYQAYWCWTESFLVISTWPQLGFIRIYMASCKQFDPIKVTKFLESVVGPVLKFEFIAI